jgi:hypothetical protein
MIFSEVDKRLADGSDEHLSILDMALRIAGVLTSKALDRLTCSRFGKAGNDDRGLVMGRGIA